MPRAQSVQLNVRSSFARTRVAELTRTTGMTATQVVEEALRAYVPVPSSETPTSLVWRDGVLVRPSNGRTVTLEETNAALEAVRNREDDD